ncbi:diphthine synthase [Candidatus Woesearchaeota archaeon]|nr:diphthine synthase [Candidatus Woesearchaeota archaeon]MBW3021319.1 diphthine synthase [Candidatus Woesearchaeota archaeon]
MTLYLIGIGLNDEKDITLKALETVKNCEVVYLESYTSKLNCDVKALENLYGKKIILADRDMVENHPEETIIRDAKEKDVAFLVVGDIFGATTHADIRLRAHKLGIDVKFIHNASIMNAISVTGLELYKFGKTTSIVFPEPGYEPQTPYDVIKKNLKHELHTLCLLDIKCNENRFMTVNQALQTLKNIEQARQENIITDDTLVIGCARIGSGSPTIKYGTVKQLIEFDFGEPLHCLIIPGKLHFIEEEILSLYQG